MDSFKGPKLPILFLLFAKAQTAIVGAVRLQKMVFILKEEYSVSKRSFTSISFKPHKFGMYSQKIPDDLIFLTNLNLVTNNKANVVNLDFMMDEEDDLYKPIEYFLTEKGIGFVKKIIEDAKKSDPDKIAKILKACDEVKEKFNTCDIRDLLKYVYKKYPEYTVKSEILTKILGTE